MSCPSEKPNEIRICSQNKVVEDGLRKFLKKHIKNGFDIFTSSEIKKSTKKLTKKITIKKLTKKNYNKKIYKKTYTKN